VTPLSFRHDNQGRRASLLECGSKGSVGRPIIRDLRDLRHGGIQSRTFSSELLFPANERADSFGQQRAVEWFPERFVKRSAVESAGSVVVA
jgi:hypothetical protein